MSRGSLPPVPDLTICTPIVTRVLGQNPGPYTLNGSNIYIVGTGPRRILIDTGEGKPDFVPLLQQAMRECGAQGLQEIILTHHHDDHIGGINDVQKLYGPIPMHKCHRLNAARYQYTISDAESEFNPEGEKKYLQINDGQVFRTEGATLRTVYTPGHCEDHMCLILEEENALFSGDTILGYGTTVFQDLYDYVSSLRRLLSLSPAKIYPAHGLVVEDACGKIREIIQHRQMREDQIVALLEKKLPSSLTASDIVQEIYENLAPALVPAAASNVILHILKLVREGKAQKASPASTPDYNASWSIVSSSSSRL